MNLLILIIWAHFLIDFNQQRDWALNKHHSYKALSMHVITYFGVLLDVLAVYSLLGYGWDSGPFLIASIAYATVNSLGHFGIDAVTSNLVAAHWRKHEEIAWHWIGLDQAIHVSLLIYTMRFFQ